MARTVFVLGAASSLDFDNTGQMPIGAALATQIRTNLKNEAENAYGASGPIVSALSAHGGFTGGFTGDHLDAMRIIVNNIHAVRSIDDLISEWKDKPLVGKVAKVAIAYSLLAAERASQLLIPTSERSGLPDVGVMADRLEGLKASWLGIAHQRLNPGAPRRMVEEVFTDLAFINFNYDRCIEQYLYAAFCTSGRADEVQARLAVQNIPITHVYGSLGPLIGGRDEVPFGADERFLVRAANGIRTYNESCEDSTVSKIQSTIRGAEKVIFLGFAFHPSNLGVLFGVNSPSLKHVFATIYGLRPREVQSVQDALINNESLDLAPMTCSAFLESKRDEIFEIW
jgi:hypothetical protein